MSCPFLIHRCGVRGRTWAFPVSGNEIWNFLNAEEPNDESHQDNTNEDQMNLDKSEIR